MNAAVLDEQIQRTRSVVAQATDLDAVVHRDQAIVQLACAGGPRDERVVRTPDDEVDPVPPARVDVPDHFSSPSRI